jgi:hypothetical protein
MSCSKGTGRRALRVPLLATTIALALVSGCRFGQAGFEGSLGERAFDPSGTVFGYLDARDDNLDERDTSRVGVAMTWLIFDPTSDLNDLPGDELENYRHELRLRDALSLVFADSGAVTPGATFESVVEGGSELGDGALRARIHLAPERLTASSTYAGFVPYGARRKVNVSLDEARLLEDGPLLSGSIVVDIEQADTDPSEVITGRLEGRFTAPLVSERTAERNLSLLIVDDILGLPLADEDPS